MSAPAQASKRAAALVSDRLAAGPPRGLGTATAIVAEALQEPQLLPELLPALVQALGDPRPIVQNRAARTLKKIQAVHTDALDPLAKRIVQATIDCTDLRARWNLLIVCGNLHLHGAARALAIDLMFESLHSASALVRTFAMQALVNFAADDASLRTQMQPIVQAALDNPSPAVRARARKLLPQLSTAQPSKGQRRSDVH